MSEPADATPKIDYVPIASPGQGLPGEVLPFPEPQYEPITEPDYRRVNPPPRQDIRPPKGAPNIVIVLMDQLAYADPSTFGGQIRTPTLDRLAENGLTYTNFHVNALCSPSRMALLTGRNQHQCSTSTVVDTSTGYPSDSGVRPESCATIGRVLGSWGYVTSYFGKCHEVPPYEISMSGPFDRWPARSGWDKFYGYLAGEQSSLNPNLIDGTTHIGTPNDPEYHFNIDVTDQAIAWMRGTRSLTPDRPFLMYYSQSAGHPPHTPPKEWLEKDPYKGKFDQGWDVMREEILARQKAMGIVAPDTQLAENPPYVGTWDTLTDDEKKVFSRQMEVYAALVESADREVGRLVDAIDEIGELDNTLFIYIAGDNGGSSIGEENGVFVEWSGLNEAPEDVDYLLKRLEDYGGPKSYPNYSVGWALAGSTPATWCIQMAHAGGNMAGMVVHWPKGIKPKGEKRRQYTSLIDVVPTVLEAVGIPEPKVVAGVPQTPVAGVAMNYSFDDGQAKERHTTQYNEVSGNRSIYHDGWLAAVVHRAPWEHKPRVERFEDDTWELFHMAEDFGLANDVADQYPEKLEEMKRLFHEEALKYGVYPLDDRSFERLNPVAAGRPDLMWGRTELTLYPGMTGMTENTFINTKAVSYTITAQLDVPEGGAEGVVLSQAGQTGGWSLYVKDGKPKYVYNWLAREEYAVEGAKPLPEGPVELRFDFDYDGGGLHKGATGRLYVNGDQVGEGRIDRTMGAIYSLAGETADVGMDAWSPVTDDYDPWDNAFTGTIHKITVKLHDPAEKAGTGTSPA
ncbi:arylsulfatase [Streptomyces sp. NBC_00094]|uniref:arylsulfatase n=1 Tax=Streptomyces sp. NBC_00094 TaxID=2903620 RepID=UPI00225A32B1|nr:arylsulfatase [Streptomyces sp. NBC_00094]MCX5390552.1 arylsulfatase [Streptomyces sp. NBC_00094]